MRRGGCVPRRPWRTWRLLRRRRPAHRRSARKQFARGECAACTAENLLMRSAAGITSAPAMAEFVQLPGRVREINSRTQGVHAARGDRSVACRRGGRAHAAHKWQTREQEALCGVGVASSKGAISTLARLRRSPRWMVPAVPSAGRWATGRAQASSGGGAADSCRSAAPDAQPSPVRSEAACASTPGRDVADTAKTTRRRRCWTPPGRSGMSPPWWRRSGRWSGRPRWHPSGGR